MAEEQWQAFVSLWIDGKPMADFEDRVRYLEVAERTLEASSFRMVMAMSPSQTTWPLIDDERFQLMRRITIELGLGSYRDRVSEKRSVIFDGYLTSVEPHFGPQRVPDSTLEVAGLDASCLMHFEARLKEWKDQTDAAIACAIFKSYGFAVDVASTGPSRQARTGSLLQRGTDAEFLRLLARRNGFEFYVEPDGSTVAEAVHAGSAVVGHFHPPRVERQPQPPLSLFPLAYPSLIEFRARWDSHRPTRVVSRTIDPESRRIQTAVQEKPPLKQLGKKTRQDLLKDRMAVLRKQATLDAVGLQHAQAPHHESELRAFALADYLESNWLAEATGRVQGLRYPDILRARRPVDVDGCGELANGPWYVRTACHRWDRSQATDSYEVDVELVRDALGRAG
jgi:phage protein D